LIVEFCKKAARALVHEAASFPRDLRRCCLEMQADLVACSKTADKVFS